MVEKRKEVAGVGREVAGPEYEFKIGDYVRHVSYCKDVHDDWAGLVTAREVYENQAGSSNWYYVRWIEPGGQVHNDPVRIGEMELERLTDGQ